MRVAVTGARGFIDSAAVRALEKAGHDVHAVPFEALSSDQGIRRALEGFEPDCVLHVAWTTGPDRITNVDGNRQSQEGSFRLIDVLRTMGCARMVFVGSGVEDEVNSPIGESPYATAKREVHDRLAAVDSPEFSTLCAHVFGVIGPGEPTWRAVPKIIRGILHGETVDVSSGTQRRDILHVDDVSSALVSLLESTITGVADVCSGESRPLREMFEAVEDAAGVHGLVRYGGADLAPTELYEAAGRPTGLHAVGWNATHSWESAAADAVAWWRTQS